MLTSKLLASRKVGAGEERAVRGTVVIVSDVIKSMMLHMLSKSRTLMLDFPLICILKALV